MDLVGSGFITAVLDGPLIYGGYPPYSEMSSIHFSSQNTKKNPVTFDQCNQFWKRNIIIRCRQMNRDVISNVSYD